MSCLVWAQIQFCLVYTDYMFEHTYSGNAMHLLWFHPCTEYQSSIGCLVLCRLLPFRNTICLDRLFIEPSPGPIRLLGRVVQSC